MKAGPRAIGPQAPTAVAAPAIQDEIVKAGWRPGRNAEWRSAEGDSSRFKSIIDELEVLVELVPGLSRTAVVVAPIGLKRERAAW